MSAVIDRIAKAIFLSEGWPENNWETISEHGDGRQSYRDKARAAISVILEEAKGLTGPFGDIAFPDIYPLNM